MNAKRFVRIAAAVLGAALAAAPATPQSGAAAIPLIDRLEAGQWELRGTGNALIASICIGDRAQLFQPRHRGASCTRTLIGATAHEVTVRYSCPAAGSGQTTIRVETPRLAQIESQGLDGGAPFALRAEARRTGACA